MKNGFRSLCLASVMPRGFVHAEQAFVVDFYFKTFKLAVEIDGTFHSRQKLYDKWRSEGGRQIETIRFANDEVDDDIYDVMCRTLIAIRNRPMNFKQRRNLENQLRLVGRDKPDLCQKLNESCNGTVYCTSNPKHEG